MENIKIKKNVNDIMWVEYWIKKAHPSFEDCKLTVEKYTFPKEEGGLN